MIKLKKKYPDLKNNKFTIGDVVKIFYIVFLRTKRKKKKMYSFIGLCINKKKNYFDLVNIVKKEKIFLSFDINSPVIFKIVVLKIYKKLIYRISRIYFKQNNYYFDDFKNKDNKFISDFTSFKKDFFIFGYFKRGFIKRKRRLKKFRRKYSYTENWKLLKEFMFEFEEATDELSESNI